MMYGYWDNFALGGELLTMLGCIFVITVVVMFIASLRERRESWSINLLKERYAKGEIDKVTFEQMKKDLAI